MNLPSRARFRAKQTPLLPEAPRPKSCNLDRLRNGRSRYSTKTFSRRIPQTTRNQLAGWSDLTGDLIKSRVPPVPRPPRRRDRGSGLSSTRGDRGNRGDSPGIAHPLGQLPASLPGCPLRFDLHGSTHARLIVAKARPLPPGSPRIGLRPWGGNPPVARPALDGPGCDGWIAASPQTSLAPKR